MDGQNFSEQFSSSGILDGTGPTSENPIGLMSPVSGNNQEQPSRPHQASVDSAMLPVYETLGDPKLDLTPASEKITEFPAPLLDPDESELLRTRWNKIQATFVDDPQSAIDQADALVSELVMRISKILADGHSSLVSEWHQNNDTSTEELRKVLEHYRSFFNQIVN